MSRCRSGASFSSSKGNFRNHLGQGLEDLIFRVRIARLSQNRIRAINRVSAWSFPQIGISSVVFQWLAHWLVGGRNQIRKGERQVPVASATDSCPGGGFLRATFREQHRRATWRATIPASL